MKKIAVLMILLAAVLTALPGNADAASLKMKKLKAGKTYKIDLNGGKKEKVKYTVKEVNESTQRFKLYVNGKVVFKKDIDDWSLISSVKTVDFIKKDKYTEIFVDVAGSYSNWWFFVLRYVSPKKVVACTKFTNVKGKMCPLNTSRTDSGKYKTAVARMDNKEIEQWYDFCHELCAAAILLLGYDARHNEVEMLKERIAG